MKKFEYKIIRVLQDEDMSNMNKLGEEGWELVTVLKVSEYCTKLYFKREILNKKLW